MGGIENWFSFVSKEQREQREKDYYQRMFPMGEAQKAREEELLKLCILTRVCPSEKLYQLLIVKEALLQPDEKRKMAALKKWYNAPLAKKLTQEERAILLALGELELGCGSVEELPEQEAVCQKSRVLLAEYIQKLLPDRDGLLKRLIDFSKLLQK